MIGKLFCSKGQKLYLNYTSLPSTMLKIIFQNVWFILPYLCFCQVFGPFFFILVYGYDFSLTYIVYLFVSTYFYVYNINGVNCSFLQFQESSEKYISYQILYFLKL